MEAVDFRQKSMASFVNGPLRT